MNSSIVLLSTDPVRHATLLFLIRSQILMRKSHCNQLSWHDQGIYLRSPWTTANKNQTLWLSGSAVLLLSFLNLWPYSARHYQRNPILTLASHQRCNTGYCPPPLANPVLCKRHLWSSRPRHTFLMRRRQQDGPFILAVFTPNHGHFLDGFKSTRRVIWALGDEILCR